MFEVLNKVVVNDKEYERVREKETGREAIRYRYDNIAGQTSRCCPTVWIDELPDFLKAVMELATMELK